MPLGIGEYPPEYNPRIHGPYNPARYYGPADKPFGEVKLGEMGSWLSRRSFHPLSIARGMGRGYWTWANKWTHVKRGGIAGYVQASLMASLLFYATYYNSIKYHRHFKYH